MSLRPSTSTTRVIDFGDLALDSAGDGLAVAEHTLILAHEERKRGMFSMWFPAGQMVELLG